TLILSGLSMYNGGTTISGGTLSISDDLNLGAIPAGTTPGSLVINGGTLQATANILLTSNRGIALGPTSGSGTGAIDVTSGNTLGPTSGSGTGTIDVTGSNVLIYGGVLANNGGTGNLAKTNAGTLTLSGINTYSGTTTVSGGVLSIGADANLGSAPGSATPG